MITKNQAKEITLRNNYYWVTTSIDNCIYQSIVNQLFHCEWYTPVEYDALIIENVIKDYISYLKSIGYKITMTKFNPTKDFKNTRIKLHINWE